MPSGLLFSFDRLTDVETREDFLLRNSKSDFVSGSSGCEYWTLGLRLHAGMRSVRFMFRKAQGERR
jgi:hypothetical protein